MRCHLVSVHQTRNGDCLKNIRILLSMKAFIFMSRDSSKTWFFRICRTLYGADYVDINRHTVGLCVSLGLTLLPFQTAAALQVKWHVCCCVQEVLKLVSVHVPHATANHVTRRHMNSDIVGFISLPLTAHNCLVGPYWSKTEPMFVRNSFVLVLWNTYHWHIFLKHS